MSNFCPEWIFSICSASTAGEFLSQNTSIESCAVKYADGLSSNYTKIEPELISLSAQGLLLFLSEIDAGETAMDLLNNFIFNRLKFEATKKPRKLRSLFGSAFDPDKSDNSTGLVLILMILDWMHSQDWNYYDFEGHPEAYKDKMGRML